MMAVGLLVAAAAIGIAVGKTADAQTHRAAARSHAAATMDMRGMVTPRQLAFRNAMRVLWEQHVAWTRLAIVSFSGNLPDLSATEARLLRNQHDIGAAIVPFYGRAAGHRLTALLRQHILIAVRILGDVRSGDSAAARAGQRRLVREREPDLGLPARRQPAPLAARGAAGHDAPAPEADDERGGRGADR